MKRKCAMYYADCVAFGSRYIWKRSLGNQRRRGGNKRTLRSQIFPTFFDCASSGSISTGAADSSTVDSSLSPCSLAKWSRQMKQKLVLISSIFSLGYDRCSPEMTEPNTRASAGSVGVGSSGSTSCAQEKKLVQSTACMNVGTPTILLSSSAFCTTISSPFQMLSFSFRTSTLFARFA